MEAQRVPTVRSPTKDPSQVKRLKQSQMPVEQQHQQGPPAMPPRAAAKNNSRKQGGDRAAGRGKAAAPKSAKEKRGGGGDGGKEAAGAPPVKELKQPAASGLAAKATQRSSLYTDPFSLNRTAPHAAAPGRQAGAAMEEAAVSDSSPSQGRAGTRSGRSEEEQAGGGGSPAVWHSLADGDSPHLCALLGQ